MNLLLKARLEARSNNLTLWEQQIVDAAVADARALFENEEADANDGVEADSEDY